ncbi:transcriptional regulator BetI [Eubacterium limosum]|uniref:Transcriptional regulator BetI n=1 Tax=Eubacterium limosum TaxID=1736 RepID=A0A6N3H869_EUBLI
MAAVDQREENMPRVIEAAIWCFENVGIEKTTRVLIAKKAGVTVRSIQRYFGTLENLIVEAIGVYMQRYNNCLKAELNRLAESNANGYEQLIAFLRNHLNYYRPDMPKSLVVHEMELYFLKHDIPLTVLYQKVFNNKTQRSVIGELFKKGLDDGSIKKHSDIEVIYAYLVTTFPGMLIRISMMGAGFKHVPTNVTTEMIFDKYIEILGSLIKA